MKKIIPIIALLFLSLSLFSQQNNQKTDTTMKKQILGLRTCLYVVPNLSEAKTWYTKAFETEPYFDEPFYVGFNIGGYELGLLPEEKEYKERTDNVVMYWGVEEVQPVYDRLLAIGATAHEEPHSVGGPLIVASVKDPWGNVIGLIYNPVFKLPEE
ncbi:MAG TPA: VOC family protein [Bacteroidales bacterium]|nr:VOC family protein [Bacteroidales bacterium]HRX95518.1 VOC family protein [Bacteroidales bacterium]